MPPPSSSPRTSRRKRVNPTSRASQPPPAGPAARASPSLASSSMGTSTARSLEEQLDLWVELAKTLEGKLDHQQKENERLKEKVVKSSNICQELQEEVQFKTARIQELEQQCSNRTSKLSQLAQIITAKKSNKLESELIDKSTEVAELQEAQQALQQRYDELSAELSDANLAMSNMRKDREKNNRLLLELSDIVRTLNRIAIDYEKDCDNDSTSTPSSHTNVQDQSLRNVKRKIEAIDSDRQRLVEERRTLKEENDALIDQMACMKDERDHLRKELEWAQMEMEAMKSKIDTSERSFQDINRNRRSSESSSASSSASSSTSLEREQCDDDGAENEANHKQVRTHQYPSQPPTSDNEQSISPMEGTSLSYSTSEGSGDGSKMVDDEGGNHADTADEFVHSRQSVVSTSSSFSVIEPPPSTSKSKLKKRVPLKEHEALRKVHNKLLDKHERLGSNQKQLKKDFDKALDVIERLRMELSKRKAAVQSLESSKALADDLQRDLNQAIDEISVLRIDNKSLKRDLHEARRAYDDVLHNYNVLKDESNSRVVELTEMRDLLQRQYEELEVEYSTKIDTLENKLVEAKQETIKAIEVEKRAEQDRRKLLSIEHDKAMEVQHNSYEDLKNEYDTFLEIHLKTEDDLKAVEIQYGESLTKISELESQLMEMKDARAAEISKHEADLSASQRATDDVLRQNQKLRKELDASIMDHEKTKVDAAATQNEVKEMYELLIANERRLKDEVIQKYEELRRLHDEAVAENALKEQDLTEKYKSTSVELERVILQNAKAVAKLQQMNKQSSEEVVSALKEQWKKRLEQSREQLEWQRKEAKQQIEIVESKLREEIQSLRTKYEEAAQKLKKLEFSESRYKNLQSSYGAAIIKIESLLRETNVKRPSTVQRGRSVAPRRGRVSERISAFERKNCKLANKKVSDAKEDANSIFQRDLAIIMERVQTEEDCASPQLTSFESADISTTTQPSTKVCANISAPAKTPTTANYPSMSSTADCSTQTDFGDNIDQTFFSDTLIQKSLEGKPAEYLFFSVVRHATFLHNVHLSLLAHPTFKVADSSNKRPRQQEHDHTDQLPKSGGHQGKNERSIIKDIARQFDAKNEYGNNKGKGGPQKIEIEDISLMINQPIFSVKTARNEAQHLKRLLHQNGIRIDAAAIQSQAREKNVRLLELQFKNLRQKYNESVQNDTGIKSDDVESGKDNSLQTGQLNEQLAKAEAQLKATKRGLYACKDELEAAREEQEKEDITLQTTIQEIQSSDSWSDVMPPPGSEDLSETGTGKGTVSTPKIFDENPIVREGDQESIQSEVTNADDHGLIVERIGEETQCEERDTSTPNTHLSLWDKDRIDSIQLELRRAKEAAELAREKQREREENLRDVIFQYKNLKLQHEELAATMKRAMEKNQLHAQNQHIHVQEEKKDDFFDTPTDVSVVSEFTMMRLHNDLEEGRRRMAVMEKELERAQSSATKAREAQMAQQQNLRDAVANYKALQDQFMTVLREKKELEKALRVNKTIEMENSNTVKFQKDQQTSNATTSLSSCLKTAGFRVPPVTSKVIEQTTKFYNESILKPVQEVACNGDITNCAADIWDVLTLSPSHEKEPSTGQNGHHVVFEPIDPINKSSSVSSATLKVGGTDNRDHRGNYRTSTDAGCGGSCRDSHVAKTTSEVHIGNVHTRIEIFDDDDDDGEDNHHDTAGHMQSPRSSSGSTATSSPSIASSSSSSKKQQKKQPSSSQSPSYLRAKGLLKRGKVWMGNVAR